MSDPIDRNVLMDALKTIQGCLPSTPCMVNNGIHLCDSCKYSYPSCPSSKFDVVFGDSVGHDNICACNKYQPRYDEEWRKMHYESSYSQGFLEGVRMCEQAQPKITDEQAIEHLQKAGWMQNHDKQMYEMGLREQLADDSDSYDALLPSAQPERPKGHWIFVHPLQENDSGAYICSECKTGDWDINPVKDKVCKFCRADMKGEQDESD